MRLAIAAALCAALSACSAQAQTISRVDAADIASTAIAISRGAVELNPVVGIAGNSAAPLVAIGAKVVAKRIIIAQGATPAEADYLVGIGSAFGAGNNLAVILGASGPVGVAMGAIAAFAHADMNRPGHEKDRSPRFERWHDRDTR